MYLNTTRFEIRFSRQRAKGWTVLNPNSKTTKTFQSSKDWFPHIQTYTLPTSATLELNKANWEIDKRKSALLVHDMQNFWVERFIDPSFVVDAIAQVIELCRQNNIPVIYSVGEKARNLAERGLSLDLWGPGIASSDDVTDSDPEIVDALAPQPQDYIVMKTKYSAFFKTDLEQILQRTGRNQLLITGIFAHHGCMATALDAFMRNIEIFFVANALGDYSLEKHLMAINYVAETSGIISTVDSIRAALR